MAKMLLLTFRHALLAAASLAMTAAAPADLVERQNAGLSYNQNWGDGLLACPMMHFRCRLTLDAAGTAKFKYKSGPGNAFSVTWSGDKGNFVVGRGWNTGSSRFVDPFASSNPSILRGRGTRNVSFTGVFEPKGNAYLTLYGWTTGPLIEYYIVDNYGDHRPCSDNPEAVFKGNFTQDGDEYQICTKVRKNKPSIQGTATFSQYWSIRNTKRSSGTIDAGAHFKAWNAVGLKLGRQNYMVLAVEGQDSSGSATITIGTTGTAAPAAKAAVLQNSPALPTPS